MENVMQAVSAIICFNSGSAGDLLRSLCLDQLTDAADYHLDSNGAVNLEKQYFKEITKQIYYQQRVRDDIDLTQVTAIENTHYYLDFYPELTQRIYFINYPDHYQVKILESVKKKRHNNSWENFLESNREYLPEFARDRATINNVIDVFGRRWQQNLKGWRNTAGMIPIEFTDFFDSKKMQLIVETVIAGPLTDPVAFLAAHQQWLEKNQDLQTN